MCSFLHSLYCEMTAISCHQSFVPVQCHGSCSSSQRLIYSRYRCKTFASNWRPIKKGKVWSRFGSSIRAFVNVFYNLPRSFWFYCSIVPGTRETMNKLCSLKAEQFWGTLTAELDRKLDDKSVDEERYDIADEIISLSSFSFFSLLISDLHRCSF